jgi:hypothetical protein
MSQMTGRFILFGTCFAILAFIIVALNMPPPKDPCASYDIDEATCYRVKHATAADWRNG